MALRKLLNQISTERPFVSPFLSIFNRNFTSNMGDSPVKLISFEDLRNSGIGSKVMLVDVREPSELKEDGKIPNSVNVPLGEVDEAFKLQCSLFEKKYGVSKPGVGSDLVVTCRSGKRATNAYQVLRTLGYQNVSVYDGSFLDWVKNGGTVEK